MGTVTAFVTADCQIARKRDFWQILIVNLRLRFEILPKNSCAWNQCIPSHLLLSVLTGLLTLQPKLDAPRVSVPVEVITGEKSKAASGTVSTKRRSAARVSRWNLGAGGLQKRRSHRVAFTFSAQARGIAAHSRGGRDRGATLCCALLCSALLGAPRKKGATMTDCLSGPPSPPWSPPSADP